MAKLMLFVFVTLLAATLIMGATDKTCGRHGDPCASVPRCCDGLRCHPYANRCQVIITEEELMAQREKILGRKGKDY
ncbi:PREDICTED: omega-conotoxin-like protein 1 [Wasmannia auropunctata]|uniref:omega-conotoxin-like protein 1 n=1 Tax=Wasmannia auropunctata TaxID=64793 RepID=UPI0005EFD4B5|nr:PREDICTED: omega-conotoxin-like protein 1 [Wasmannia auropunctata]